MEHIQGFTQSHWMPPPVECLRRITPAAAMVKEFESNTQNTVIGHGIGGKHIPAKMAQLAESQSLE